MQSIARCPTCFKMGPSARRPAGRRCVAPHKSGSSIECSICYEKTRLALLYLPQLAFTRALQLIAVKYPIGNAPNSF